jgi:hypothetical protein
VCASRYLGTGLHTPHDIPRSIANLAASIECEAEDPKEACKSKQHSNYYTWPTMSRGDLIENQRGPEIDETAHPETQGLLFQPPVLGDAPAHPN